MASPSWTGQRALQPLPSKSLSSKRGISTYHVADNLIHDGPTLQSSDHGLTVMKINKTGKLQPRRIALSRDRRSILVTTHRIRSLKGFWKAAIGRETKAKVIPISSVDRIQRGANSKRFVLWTRNSNNTSEFGEGGAIASNDGKTGLPKELREAEYLSIVFRSSESPSSLDTLDLVVPNLNDYEVLLTTLEDIIALWKVEKQRFTGNVQLLQYHWVETLNKDLSSSIALPEWMTLMDALQVNLKKPALATVFKEDCSKRHHSEDQLMSFPNAAILLDDVREASFRRSRNPVMKLWNDLMETDPVPFIGQFGSGEDDASLEMSIQGHDEEPSLSSVSFLSFLRTHQKQYKATLEDAIDLIKILNQQHTALDLDEDEFMSRNGKEATATPARVPQPSSKGERLTRSRFFSYLTSDANDLLDPVRGREGVDDMTQPLSHYWINTSHDSYLAKSTSWRFSATTGDDPSPEVVDEQMYTSALLRGVRCLELDIWDDPAEKEPLIARRRPEPSSTDKTIPLGLVLRLIRHFLQQHPYTFPVILRIENHCCPTVQLVVAQLLYEILGAAELIATPPVSKLSLEDKIILPSPEATRGKVIIIGKRPKKIRAGCRVVNDDFDDENYVWDVSSSTGETMAAMDSFDDEEKKEDDGQIIIGFDSNGPIRTSDPNALLLSPAEMLEAVDREASAAQRKATEAKLKVVDLHREAENKEQEATQLMQKAGMAPEDVKQRAATAANRVSDPSDYLCRGEEKSAKEEGVEIYEILPNFVEEEKDRYVHAAQDALEAENRVQLCASKLKEADESLTNATHKLEASQKRHQKLLDNARRAAAEARSHWEYAETARARVEEVRELLRDSQTHASSAGTVVVTALTEAKISEKRAADAEARAARATASAEKDRARAEEEIKKEEALENEVSLLHAECAEATEVSLTARERVEKAAAMLDRVNEQVMLMEASSQFRKERDESRKGGAMKGPNGAKYSAKLEERNICRELIKEATQENAAAEARRTRAQRAYEEKNQLWKMQVELAAQVRKVADRSTHMADELVEHAEEEREAATLRHFAREKAESAVTNRDMQKESVQEQLAEAERASAEAANIAVQSRKRADHLEREAEKVKDDSTLIRAVEQMKWEKDEAQAIYGAAVAENKRKVAIVEEEKRRLDTAAEVYTTAARDAAVATDLVKVAQLYEQEAIVAYNKALMLRQQAAEASKEAKNAVTVADEKRLAARRAREYKEKMDLRVEIPTNLAKLTLLHSLKYRHWDRSLSLSSAHVHSISQDVLFLMHETEPEYHRKNLEKFTQDHLVRAFPTCKSAEAKNPVRCDPVFAWSLGCQLVPTKLYAFDEHALVVDGRFRQNGSCGYVLKPEHASNGPVAEDNRAVWSFRILCGFNLPRQSGTLWKASGQLNPIVKIALHTKDIGRPVKEYWTKPTGTGGLSVVWDPAKVFEFEVLSPGVEVFTFTVWDRVDGSLDYIGGAAVPAVGLREGYRSVSLFDTDNSRCGPFAFSALLVNASKR